MAIKIMTDSACCETRDLNGVEILPMSVNVNNTAYLDKKKLEQEDFFRYLMRPKEKRLAVGVTEEQFIETFNKFSDQTIVGVFTGSKLSRTFANAMMAKKKLNRNDIYLLDSGSVSIGISMLVECSAKFALSGCDAGEIYRKVHGMADKLEIYGIFDSIKHLVPYGKIKKSSLTTGAMPGIKSIVRIRGGVVQTMGQDMGLSRAVDMAAKIIKAKSKLDTNMPIAYVHKDNLAEVERLMCKLGQGKIYQVEGNISAQTGPNSMAIGFFNE